MTTVTGYRPTMGWLPAAQKPQTQAQPTAAAVESKGAPSVSDEFLAFMKKSPAEMMQEAWLAKHGISREEFAAMSTEEKQALLAQMKEEIAQEAKREAGKQAKRLDLTV